MTPEELIKQREQRKLLAAAAQAKSTSPTDAEKIVSDATKENFKSAGRLAANIGKAVADKTKQAAAMAAEKGREAQEALAKRAEEAKVKKEAEAAEQTRLEPERARKAGEQGALAQLEVQTTEAVSVRPEKALLVSDPLSAEVVPTPEASLASDVDVAISTPAPVVHIEEEDAPPEQAPSPLRASMVQEVAPSNAPQPLGTASKPMPSKAVAKSVTNPAKPAKTSPVVSAPASAKQGRQRVVGAGVAVLVLAGALAWWFSARSTDPVSDLHVETTVEVVPPAQPPVAIAPAVPAPPKTEDLSPVTALQEASVPAAVSKASRAAIPSKAQPAVAAPAATPAAAAKLQASRVSKPKQSVTETPKAEQKNDWQDQANSDIDAWAEKIK
ncbi:hypothetical protein [Xanthomonas graminis]|uniref:hypothetical protein n=1 Tax=Xanthomonas graminis TaxID=3390026 RepID=UPI000B035879|nr:hypothetical protein [Xanthomonas translucens]